MVLFYLSEYLFENSMMKKAHEVAKGIKDILWTD